MARAYDPKFGIHGQKFHHLIQLKLRRQRQTCAALIELNIEMIGQIQLSQLCIRGR